ncbi:MAG TPA: PIG-L deacetylase family protein [Steroidobacteraceae bacterium]
MKAIVKWLLKLLARTARPHLRTYGLLQTSKVFNRSALVWNPGGERVLVLAPHMDDEVIGCGGTLARHRTSGADVTVVFLTDGRGSGSTSLAAAGAADAEIGAIRKDEARRALREIGVEKIEFLDAPDGGLMAAAARLASRLRSRLDADRPQIVYLPFFLEEHPDHRAASEVLLEAMKGADLAFVCHGYEVWTPLFPNCLVRIDDTIEIKKRCLIQYQSQLAESDYLHTAIGLSAYRSNAFLGGTCRFAEAFCALPVADYLALYQTYRLGR